MTTLETLLDIVDKAPAEKPGFHRELHVLPEVLHEIATEKVHHSTPFAGMGFALPVIVLFGIPVVVDPDVTWAEIRMVPDRPRAGFFRRLRRVFA